MFGRGSKVLLKEGKGNLSEFPSHEKGYVGYKKGLM
jgi:hypothetical protein